jgi:hypothetical protein
VTANIERTRDCDVPYKVTGLLNNYFNKGDGKRTAQQFLAELKELSPAEKNELALGVATVIGVSHADVELLPVK